MKELEGFVETNMNIEGGIKSVIGWSCTERG